MLIYFFLFFLLFFPFLAILFPPFLLIKQEEKVFIIISPLKKDIISQECELMSNKNLARCARDNI